MPPLPTAPAKVNLFLHAGSPRPDGYHPLESLVAFADCGDALTLAANAEDFTIRVEGPFANAAGSPDQNLVLKAARAIRERVPGIRGGSFHLTKNLPAGAGLGGGSADAAAALRLIAEANGIDSSDARLRAAAEATGADVPVCLARTARIISGIGEVLSEPVPIPELAAVLVWPGVLTATPAVYRAFDADSAAPPLVPINAKDIPLEHDQFLDFLARQRNDLMQAAWRVTPEIAEADAALRVSDHALLVRMSGSGSAVFAIYENDAHAQEGASVVKSRYPQWWVMQTRLR
ncbi:MAG TPA: 4-(cytidine 5'-diphospho)-2-C-methyl-D-erythritol kinase [Xanthobacteraceae bacterium]|nr:4-(cytidine 5'-diphospho)-2-C-methyl-D-erythritol kinase [Xanthobacteraceae bacterium]